jgi:hypothetical protein
MGGAVNNDDARPAGFEPATYSLEGCCSIQLSYGREERQNSNSVLEPVKDHAMIMLLCENIVGRHCLVDHNAHGTVRGFQLDRIRDINSV